MSGGVSPEQIRGWLERAKVQHATHLVVVLDDFDSEYYPVFVKPTEEVRKVVAEFDYKNKMSKVMEVYDLAINWDEQLKAKRVFNL